MIDPKTIELRQELHSRPELSNSEFETAAIVKKFVLGYEPTEIIEGIAGSGLAVIYKFSESDPTIAIRCELDALPIHEVNHFNYKSENPGISHKCGHDGHMAIVAGLTPWLKDQEFTSGKVVLLFQPAEETGEGAKRVIDDPRFKDLQTDYVFALHNIPGQPMHSIIHMDKGFSAEVQSLIIRLKGSETHAATPEEGLNPAICLSKILASISALNIPNPESDGFAVLTPVHLNMGQKSYGISPGEAELHYTIRSWNGKRMQELKTQLKKIIQQNCNLHHLKYELEWLEYFPASTNEQVCNNLIQQASKENSFDIIERPYPFKFGEDFGWFSREYKTAMFGLGAGEDTPALHNADYDFPDELIETGISMFKSIIKNVLDDRL